MQKMTLQFYESPFHVNHDEDQASKLALKADLSILIASKIRENGWTQAVAAKQLGVTQPRLSNLISGKLESFSLDAMLALLDSLGHRRRSQAMQSADTVQEKDDEPR